MRGKQQVVANKLQVLDRILSERETLFAPLSPVVTQELKVQAWTRVLDHAKMLGLASEHRDWTFMRDKLYSVWKSRTMRKWEDYMKLDNSWSDSNGDKKPMNAIDLKILEINGEKVPPAPTLPEVQPELVYLESGEESNPTSSKESEPKQCRKHLPSRAKKSKQIEEESDSDNVQDLTLELLKTEIYLRKLQARKLEIELGLPCSAVTRNFEGRSVRNRQKSCEQSDKKDDDFDDVNEESVDIKFEQDQK